MCGIAGMVGALATRDAIAAMTLALRHRGPDDADTWVDEAAGIALGHRRLAILDLSPAGRQPMVSASGRYVIVLNGEIYNFQELRAQIEREAGPLSWRGSSDTEVLLAAIERWGVRGAVERCVGMFAFGVWDRESGEVHLARDRLGEKPLYYGWVDGALLFASELKAFRACAAFRPVVDREALTLYLRYGYVPAPWSIYEGVRKLPPASLLTVSRKEPEARPAPVPYWSADAVADAGAREPFEDEARAVEELDATLRDAVRACMVSDVPLGVFLSGGIDSSLVAALMQAQSPRPIRTFTIGFREEAYNEAEQARLVAKHLGTEHHEMEVTVADALAVIPELPRIYDEPFADSSQVPTYLVAKLARAKTTVALSGDGADELFGGYRRYTHAAALWRKVARVPRPLRRAAARAALAVPPARWDRVLRPFAPLWRRRIREGTAGRSIHKGARVLRAADFEECYRALVSLWEEPAAIVVGGREAPPAARALAEAPEMRMMRRDVVTYLPDDILVKVDRASMAVALEARAPYLDRRVVELAARLPLRMRVRDGRGKVALRQVLARYVPPEITERPKAGFAVPVAEWLRGPLRPWAEALLDEERLRREGYFEPGPIRERWAEHLSGKRDWHAQIWAVLMFQAWLEHEGKDAR